MTNARIRLVALCAALAWTIAAVVLLGDYGPVWDPVLGELPYGECILQYLTTGEPTDFTPPLRAALEFRPPHPDFELAFPFAQTHPFTAILSALSCRLFWHELAWLEAIQAHNLAVVLEVAVFVYVLVGFTARRFGLLAGVTAAVFLCLSPRWFGHSFNNLRDIPEACLYGLAAIATYDAILRGALRRWCLAGVLAAFAFAQKTNAVFLPPQMALFFVAAWIIDRIRGERLRLPWRGVLVAALSFVVAYYAVSPPIWRDPIGQMAAYFEQMRNIGNLMTSDVGKLTVAHAPLVNWHGPRHVLYTTPPVVLGLALLGAFAPRIDAKLRTFLLVWLLTPITRVALPGMRDFDGVRHFIEFYPPLAILAAIGLRVVLGHLHTWRAAAAAIAVAPCFVATVQTHPNQTCYFNALTGGLAGAAKATPPLDATDYWGNSYWQGLRWLEQNAAPNATLVVPVAEHIVRCVVPVALREDMHFAGVEDTVLGAPLYVMYVVRPGSYGPMLNDILAASPATVHDVSVQGEVVLRILKLDDAAAIGRAARMRARARRAKQATPRLLAWIQRDPAARFAPVNRILTEARAVGLDESIERLAAVVPPELYDDVRDILWWIVSSK